MTNYLQHLQGYLNDLSASLALLTIVGIAMLLVKAVSWISHRK